MSNNNHRERLVAFYTKNNPEKLNTVDATLQRFAGREEELFKALLQKYPETAAGGSTSSGAASPTNNNNNYKERLTAFYKKYNPEKISGVDATLQKCSGKEEEMFKVLVQKYGPEPGGANANAAASSSSSAANLTAAPSLTVNPSSVAFAANPPTSAGHYRERLLSYYSKYNPEKVSTVDGTLSKFVGREEEMFKALVAKYGPEPASQPTLAASPVVAPAASALPAPSSSSSASPSANYYERLNSYYKKYNPTKLNTVEATLQKFQGREEEMFNTLVAKYGPEPNAAEASNSNAASKANNNNNNTNNNNAAANASSSYKERLANFYKKYNPEKLSSVDANLSKFVGREEEMFKALVGKYGPEPQPGESNNNNAAAGAATWSYRDRLVAFYNKYNPEKLNTVDASLSKFSGREEEMFKVLVGKYGAEPEANASSSPTSTTLDNANNNNNKTRSISEFSNGANAAASSSASFRERLVRYYTKYNPEKINTVDASLTKFAGREEEMFKVLVLKYGPEPALTLGSGETSPNSNASLSAPPTNPTLASRNINNGSGANGEQQQQQEENTFKARLSRFYKKYAPEKLPKTDAHLAKYAGREEDFFKALVTSYGPEPEATPASPSLSAPPSLQQQQQQQQQIVGEAPTTKQRLTAFYQKYCADKVAKVDDHLAKYAGREEELFKALVTKYGPEPKSGAISAIGAVAVAEPVTFKSRLTAMYSKYCADKVPKVDDHLSKYAGREEELLKALVTKYGPEPKIATPVSAPLVAAAAAGALPNRSSPSQQQLEMNRSVSSAASSPSSASSVDPVRQILSQQIALLPADEAQQLSALANSTALLHLIKNVSNTLGGSAGNAGAVLSEAKRRAVCENEAEQREVLQCVAQDEFGILAHMARAASSKIRSAEESDQLQQKSNQLLRKMYLDMWGDYARGRIKARKREAASMLTPYQRIAFSKSKSGYLRFQEDNNLSPNSASFGSPGRAKPIVTNRTNPAPIPTQAMTGFSQQQPMRRAASSSTSTTAMNTPRNIHNNNNNNSFASSRSNNTLLTNNRNYTNNLTSSSTSRGVSPRNFGQPQQHRAASTSSSFISAAHQNTTLNPNLVSVNPSRAGNNLSQPPTSRTNVTRHELAKNRHSAETRVEKLSDNQLRSLHRRLEKWGLPVPGFVQTTIKARGIAEPSVLEQQQQQLQQNQIQDNNNSKRGNNNNISYGHYDPYDKNYTNTNNDNKNAVSSPYQDQAADLDSQVSKILDSMQQQVSHERGDDWS